MTPIDQFETGAKVKCIDCDAKFGGPNARRRIGETGEVLKVKLTTKGLPISFVAFDGDAYDAVWMLDVFLVGAGP